MPQSPLSLPRERLRPGPPAIHIEAKAKSFRQLIDFQKKLAALPGVARVSINALDDERMSLVVELEFESPQA